MSVLISNVTEAPYYDTQNPSTLENWEANRQKPGIWAEIGGKNFIFTVPSSCLKEVTNPNDLVAFWDQIIELHQYKFFIFICK